MEVGVAFDDVGRLKKDTASLGKGGIEIIDGCKMLVDERLVDKGPCRRVFL
jgi:hypothetical protein